MGEVVGYTGLWKSLNAPFPHSPVNLATVRQLNQHPSFPKKLLNALQNCLPV